jgi:natural product biosynthesis luciferase-like monooxygenase protein
MKSFSERLEAARRKLSPEQREFLERRIHDPRGEQFPRVRPRVASGRAPLTFAQERLWFMQGLDPANPAFAEHVLLRLRGELSRPSMLDALAFLIRRHGALRTSIEEQNGIPQQLVHDQLEISPQHHDLKALAEPERERELLRIARRELQEPFLLSQPPLVRVCWFELSEWENVLLWVNHHIISDGQSRALLMRELLERYDAVRKGAVGSVDAPPLAVSYADYATWEREELVWSSTFREQLEHWKTKLAEPRSEVWLPTDRPRSREQSHAGSVFERNLPAELVVKVNSFARMQRVTPFSTLLGAFFALLHKHGGQTDIMVGVPSTARRSVELEKLVGLLINTLCIRLSVTPGMTFEGLVAAAQATTTEAMTNGDVPFERVVQEVSPQRDASRSPLFQVLFSMQTQDTAPLAASDLTIELTQVDSGAARLDLAFELVPFGEKVKLHVEYNRALFEHATIERLVSRYVTLLESALAAPGEPLSALHWIPAAELEELQRFSRGPESTLPDGATLISLFAEQVERSPDEEAVVSERVRLTYRQLAERTADVAAGLLALGVAPGDRVVVNLEHGVDLVVALLGVLTAGAAYVPLDPSYPEERQRFIAEDCRAKLFVTSREIGPRTHATAGQVVSFNELAAQSHSRGSSERPLATPDRPAYVMYTSGSTGTPKGVVVTHQNVLNFCLAVGQVIPGAASGRATWLALTSFAFDISVLELLWPLTLGARVVVPTQSLEDEADASGTQTGFDFSLFFFAADAAHDASDKYGLVLQAARFADEHGFQALWSPERHFHSFGGLYPNPSVLSAALAATTRHVQIRAGSVVLPLHHPVRVVEEWSVVDNLSKGRAGVSFASGWHADDFVLAPDNYVARKARLLESLDLVRRLWRGEEITFQNGVAKPTPVRCLPRPIQSELPVWLTSSGDPKTFEVAGEQGTFVLTHLLGQSVEDLAQKIQVYRAAWANAKHPGRAHVTLMLHTFIGDDVAAVKAVVREPFRRYLATSLDLVGNLAKAMGIDVHAANFRQEDMDALLDHAFDRYFETSGLMGTIESCAPMLERLMSIGVDEIACLIDFGVDQQAVLESLPKLNELRKRTRRAMRHRVEGALAGFFEQFAVTHFQCTPSVAAVLARDLAPEKVPSLETLLVGGEVLPPALAQDLRKLARRVYNMYGPTETTIWSSAHEVSAADAGKVPIGKPFLNTQLYVLDEHRNWLPPSVVGELFIGGEGVASGYLNRPELTAQRFLPDPFSDVSGARLYRTGDFVTWSSNGELLFLGRQDQQVKIRGFRIELGEIEAALGKHPAIRDAVVTVMSDASGARIVAYVVPRWGAALRTAELREFVQNRLPEYMVPSLFVAMTDLPRTANGKVDRRALPEPKFDRDASRAAYLPPRTTIERELAALWTELLGLKEVGVHDNFFDVGGHSLLATQVVARIRTNYGNRLSLRAFMSDPTIAAISAAVEAAHAEDEAP